MNFVIINGMSATGKSTRLMYFLDFLVEKLRAGIQEEKYNGKIIGNNYNLVLDTYLQFFVFGKYSIKFNTRTYQGFDSIFGEFETVNNYIDWLDQFMEYGHSIILEGSGILNSKRFTPVWYNERYNKNGKIKFYMFTCNWDSEKDVDIYKERVLKRKGHEPTMKVFDSKSKSYDKMFQEQQKLIEDNGLENYITLKKISPISEPSSIGLELFNIFNIKNDPQGFKEYCFMRMNQKVIDDKPFKLF